MTEQELNKPAGIDRREFCKLGGAVVGGGVIGVLGWYFGIRPRQQGEVEGLSSDIPEDLNSPENEPRSKIEYGFNTHMSANPAKIENLTLDTFLHDVDRLVSWGMDSVRFNVWEWEQEENELQKYDQAITYAKQNGLTVHLVTNVPQLSRNGEELKADLEKTRQYYSRLASRWVGKVDIWQVFNEPDDHTVDRYQKIQDQYPERYLPSFAALINEANATIKGIDPNAKTTVNVSMWVGADPWIGADNPRFEEVAIFDAACQFDPGGQIDRICPTIDYISLDPYLDTNEEAIKRFPEVIEYFQSRYGKPVIIAELGIPTGGDGRFTEADQAKYIPMAIDAMQGGKVRPHSILLYELRDESMKAETDAEAFFGFTHEDGSAKPGLNAILEAIAEDSEEASINRGLGYNPFIIAFLHGLRGDS